jgi:hypothetical protein
MIKATTPLQGSLGSTATVFIRWPYSLYTFDQVLRTTLHFTLHVTRAVRNELLRFGNTLFL